MWKCVQEMEDEWVQKGVAEGERKGEIKGMQKIVRQQLLQ